MPRPRAGGRLFYLGRIRFYPGRHSPELGRFLAGFSAAGQEEKLTMLQRLLDGAGASRPAADPAPATGQEDSETANLIDGLIDGL